MPLLPTSISLPLTPLQTKALQGGVTNLKQTEKVNSRMVDHSLVGGEGRGGGCDCGWGQISMGRSGSFPS